ncbi:MAG TPA: hypothetical protein DCP89_00805 [Acidimicrobiaceae bacterium]|nr:hypothetical protein [Myxococcales bacterium]HAN07013.1 hypothetical protein [Acidimicrobiaceae bacterium]
MFRPRQHCSERHWQTRLQRFALLCLVSLSACTGVEDKEQDTQVQLDPLAVIGGANDDGKDWVDWSAGDGTPPMLRGPQGGQHVWVSIRMQGLNPVKLKMTVEMRLKGTAKIVQPGAVPVMRSIPPAKDEPNTYQFSGITAFVKCPCQVADKSIEISLKLDDIYGRTASTSAVIRPTWAENCSGQQPPSCADQ